MRNARKNQMGVVTICQKSIRKVDPQLILRFVFYLCLHLDHLLYKLRVAKSKRKIALVKWLTQNRKRK